MRQQIKNLLAFLLENFLTVHMKIDNITVLYNTVIKRDSEKEAEKEMRNLEESATQQKILEAAKQEFLEKGFQGASLRNIVKTAGVTTGAFYGYYSNKEALFAALVEEHAAAVMGCFMQAQDNFEQLSGEEQSEHLSDVLIIAILRKLSRVFFFPVNIMLDKRRYEAENITYHSCLLTT